MEFWCQESDQLSLFLDCYQNKWIKILKIFIPTITFWMPKRMVQSTPPSPLSQVRPWLVVTWPGTVVCARAQPRWDQEGTCDHRQSKTVTGVGKMSGVLGPGSLTGSLVLFTHCVIYLAFQIYTMLPALSGEIKPLYGRWDYIYRTWVKSQL